jgi:GH24 family phage-related lysozyme (muramidase)
MKLDLNGVNLLAELEGLEAYKCSAGVWTGLEILFLRDGRKG